MIFCTESSRNLWADCFCKLVGNETSINLFILLRNLDHAQKRFTKVNKNSSCYFIHQSWCVHKTTSYTNPTTHALPFQVKKRQASCNFWAMGGYVHCNNRLV